MLPFGCNWEQLFLNFSQLLSTRQAPPSLHIHEWTRRLLAQPVTETKVTSRKLTQINANLNASVVLAVCRASPVLVRMLNSVKFRALPWSMSFFDHGKARNFTENSPWYFLFANPSAPGFCKSMGCKIGLEYSDILEQASACRRSTSSKSPQQPHARSASAKLVFYRCCTVTWISALASALLTVCPAPVYGENLC